MIRTFTAGLLGVLLLAASVPAGDEKAAFLVKASRQVLDRLAELKAPAAHVQPVTDKIVEQMFPEHVILVVSFQQWPVAVAPPAPLKSRNIFIVSKMGKLEHLTDTKGLETFFKAQVTGK